MAQFDFDCAVIGGGPAGLVASLYLGRYRRPTVQFAFGKPRAYWICDAYEYSGKPIVVLSQDDHGLKTSLFLRRYSKSVTAIIESEQRPSVSLVKKCERAGVRLVSRDCSHRDS